MNCLKPRIARQRAVGVGLAFAVAGLVAGVGADASPAIATQAAVSLQSASSRAAAASNGAFTKTEKISRINLVDGKDQVVDRRTFTATVNQTKNLRNDQRISVSWTGAHPTGGIFPEQTSPLASQEEYPVVLMMCHGAASATSGKNLITPETCWTQSSSERVQVDGAFNFPPYRLDRYASAADRGLVAGRPTPLPRGCTQFTAGAQHWVPFIDATGTVFDFGPQGCAGLPPDAITDQVNPLQPSNTTYGVSDLKGDGSSRFSITTATDNLSLGCSDTVSCALVIIPIMGISCDPAGDSLPPADRPPSSAQTQALGDCSATGAYAPEEIATTGTKPNPGVTATTGGSAADLTVSGQLWWSASNWRNRIVVPLAFAPLTPTCPKNSNLTPQTIFGSYVLAGATQQWFPYLCTHRDPFVLSQGTTVGDSEAKSELQTGSINAAFEGAPPQNGQRLTSFTRPIVQAPTAVTGFGIVFDIVNKSDHQYTVLHLDARLLAKLLTESYPADRDIQRDYTALRNPVTHQPNPLNIADDPEFQALNPGIPAEPPPNGQQIGDLAGVSAATLLSLNGSSDVIWALTSYINADPEARAWLNGKPDPWGMVVNPAYKNIALPTASWPLRDTFEDPAFAQSASANQCLANDPVPFLNNVAEPLDSMFLITQDLEFDISDSQTGCNSISGNLVSFQAIGQESPGGTFILGVTSLADAEHFGMPTAELETQGGSTSDKQFTTSAGRSFAAPSTASLRAAAQMMEPDDKVGTWTVPYSKMRTASAGKSAYPGTMLISTDMPTQGLTKAVASQYGRFLSFAAADGQHPGFGSGQLPPGYVPMTAANGLGKMAAYTKAAAIDVIAQNSKVPSPRNPQAPGNSSQPSPSSGSSTSGSSASGSQPSPTSSPGASASPSASPSTPTTSAGPNTTQHVAFTSDVRSAITGAILPLVLLIALIAATVAFGVWQLTRPTEPK
jgi:hypothetical protein